ncbi:hypothetical protein K435DRAFT_837587 [Dendrothele bispora CBS 962.96]|uniref:Ricin B lectin domain-containing protein n=1 Tax=Dendrothele bispora (strain CBS 962.96) TaxID=1314807 RepID=A0A4S8MBP1_DENBC|nr:hypothetical protein K435DRAFT_837587 [Dendrothele bispora CBS 962.96]
MVNLNLTSLIAGGTFLVSNFEGQVVDLAFGSSINLTPVTVDFVNGGANQHWTFFPTGTTNQFIIVSASAPGTFLSYASALTGAPTDHSQTVGSTQEATIWDLQPTDSTGTVVMFTEHASGLFLTAWPGGVSPLTLEFSEGGTQQIFTLSSVASHSVVLYKTTSVSPPRVGPIMGSIQNVKTMLTLGTNFFNREVAQRQPYAACGLVSVLDAETCGLEELHMTDNFVAFAINMEHSSPTSKQNLNRNMTGMLTILLQTVSPLL